jgi:hypothetical protein
MRLDACRKGDDVRIPHSPNGSWKAVGRVLLEKIKPLPKGLVQIKFRDTSPGSTVRKMDIPAGVIVERRRLATEADGPDAGVVEPVTAVHEGVLYQSTDPSIDEEQFRERLRQRAENRPAARLAARSHHAAPTILTSRVDMGRIAMMAALSVGCGAALMGAMHDQLEDNS